jgi:hypothetical protein
VNRRFVILAVLVSVLSPSQVIASVRRVSEAADQTVAIGAVAERNLAIDDAIRVRKELGLSTDVSTIRILLDSPDADRRLGTPLASSEVELMQTRATIQRGLQPLRDLLAAAPDVYAGHWLTYPVRATPADALTVNVGVVDGNEAAAAELRALVPNAATLRTHAVSASRRELDNIRMALRRDEGWFNSDLGVRLQMSETDVARNQVVVYVSNRTLATEAAIKERFGGGAVRVETLDGGGDDACTRTNCGPPWTGGVKIFNTTTGNGCTLGFIVRQGSTNNYGAWTSGHCKNGAWHQNNAAGALIGSTLAGSNRSVDGSTADVQIIAITAANKNNRSINDTNNCNPCNAPAFTGTTVQQPFNGDEVGDSVCANGAFTGRSCGTITSTDVDNFAYPAGVHLFNQRRATYVRIEGDSGGPVVASIGLDAAGSHTHYVTISSIKRPIYSHVWEMSLSGYHVYNGT